jgi:phosphatidylserine/phosphatidylglycerophosphate/cardiolipin synthase-like enzyme
MFTQFLRNFGILASFWLCSLRVLAGDVTLIPNPTEAAQIRIDMATRAQTELLIASYVFAEDASGLASLALLRDAGTRRVATYLVVDAFAAGKKPSLAAIKLLQNAGVDVRLFNRIRFRLDLMSNLDRTHEKLVLRDNTEYVTGGRNIENTYFGIGQLAWQDMDVFIRDPKTVAEAREHFFELFAAAQQPDTRSVTDEELRAIEMKVDAALINLKSRFPLDSGTDWATRGLPVDKIQFIADGIKTQGNETTEAVLRFMRTARQTLDIETAYLVPTEEVKLSLKDAVGRGVRVRLLTNSSESNNQWLVAAHYESDFANLAKLGVEIYEQVGPTLHSKYMVADGQRAAIMTYNLSHRSAFYDLELAVIVENETFAAQVQSEFQNRLQSSRLAAMNSTVVPRAKCFSLLSRYATRMVTGHL